MESPLKLLHQVRRRVQSVTYGSPLYRHMLDQGPVPERIRLSIVDPWPGDSRRGQALIANPPDLFAHMRGAHEDISPSFLMHEWLRDLRAVGTDMARRKAVVMIHEWIEEQETWSEENWRSEILGGRLANWIGFYDFYGPMVPESFRPTLLLSMVRQLRHLIHTAPANLTGSDNLQVVKGLIYGGLGLLDGEKALGLALDLLARQLTVEILPDGGHISRNPQMHADVLRLLIDIRSALCAGQMHLPPDLSLTIARMIPALKFFKHGDGALALFNGGKEGDALLLEAAVTLSGTRGRALKRLPHMGYERVAAGRSLMLIDVGGPPRRPYDQTAHAGLMSFEFSVGRERLLTNCGAGSFHDPDWRRAMAATAAHNTITLGNTNACELLLDGGVGHRPKEVVAQRYEQEGEQVIELSHDGYLSRQKVLLQRSLILSSEGEELRGRDVITGPPGSDFTIRWHLHPDVNVMLAQSGGSAILRTLSGSGWRLRVNGILGADLSLETSIYCGQETPRRTLQLSVTGRIKETPGLVDWVLKRERTRKGTSK